eukprot:8169864-Alexandrium_andersonii.AAC.1
MALQRPATPGLTGLTVATQRMSSSRLPTISILKNFKGAAIAIVLREAVQRRAPRAPCHSSP